MLQYKDQSHLKSEDPKVFQMKIDLPQLEFLQPLSHWVSKDRVHCRHLLPNLMKSQGYRPSHPIQNVVSLILLRLLNLFLLLDLFKGLTLKKWLKIFREILLLLKSRANLWLHLFLGDMWSLNCNRKELFLRLLPLKKRRKSRQVFPDPMSRNSKVQKQTGSNTTNLIKHLNFQVSAEQCLKVSTMTKKENSSQNLMPNMSRNTMIQTTITNMKLNTNQNSNPTMFHHSLNHNQENSSQLKTVNHHHNFWHFWLISNQVVKELTSFQQSKYLFNIEATIHHQILPT